MALPDSSSKCFERTESRAAANSCPLKSEPMDSQGFNDIFKLARPTANAYFLPSDKELLHQFSDGSKQLPRCEADKHEKRGALDVTVDKKGDLTSVTTNHGSIFYKTDGKWVERHVPYKDAPVDNLTVDCNGKLSYDSNITGKPQHYVWNPDGSYSVDAKEQGGKLVYDKDNHLIEAPAGDGHVRKFHYTNGHLDQIDGRLGHWDRVEKDGQVSWVNKDTKAVWEGDFEINPASNNLEFRSRNGAAWNFTTRGEDLQVKPEHI